MDSRPPSSPTATSVYCCSCMSATTNVFGLSRIGVHPMTEWPNGYGARFGFRLKVSVSRKGRARIPPSSNAYHRMFFFFIYSTHKIVTGLYHSSKIFFPNYYCLMRILSYPALSSGKYMLLIFIFLPFSSL